MEFVMQLLPILGDVGGFAVLLLIGVATLCRDTILRYLSKKLDLESQKTLQSRQHRFEEKFDEIRRDFERQEKFLTSFLDVSSERTKLISQQELKAAEAIWASMNKLNSFLVTTHTADLLKFDKIDEADEADRQKFKAIAKVFSGDLTSDFLASTNCQWARLYVNEAAWAFYSAYSTIVLTGTMQMKAVELGQPAAAAIDRSALKKAILEALPHQKPTLEKFPDIRATIFLDELRNALLSELKKSIHGEQSTAKEVERARAILNALPNARSFGAEDAETGPQQD